MEAGRSLLSSPPPFPTRTHTRSCVPTTCTGRHLPTSVLLQELRDEFRPPFPIVLKDDFTTTPQPEVGIPIDDSWDLDELHYSITRPSDSNLGRDLHVRESMFSSIEVAKRALSASKEAASLLSDTACDLNSVSTSLGSTSQSNILLDGVRTVRSTRRLQRESIRRKVPKMNDAVPDHSARNDVRRKTREGFDPNDPLRSFLWGPETRQLLTADEESECVVRIQELMRLEEVKSRLQLQLRREPTLLEWAEAVGVNCPILKSQLHYGKRSREKLINANSRMVVHIAKQYQGRGMSLQDLLQEGSMGLMKSIDKFKPQVGCRFATYSYWWIRQTIRKSIFRHSRTIRLPENIYGLLSKVMEAKRSYIQEGNHRPNKEEIARQAGITVERLEKLLFAARLPLSMDQPVWADQDTTFQEITADTEIEIPDVSVSKQLMRRHVRGLLNILKPNERRIIRLRYGIEDGNQKSLSQIGNILGISKERVRQLESRAMGKLKQCLGSHGLKAYADLLV